MHAPPRRAYKRAESPSSGKPPDAAARPTGPTATICHALYYLLVGITIVTFRTIPSPTRTHLYETPSIFFLDIASRKPDPALGARAPTYLAPPKLKALFVCQQSPLCRKPPHPSQLARQTSVETRSKDTSSYPPCIGHLDAPSTLQPCHCLNPWAAPRARDKRKVPHHRARISTKLRRAIPKNSPVTALRARLAPRESTSCEKKKGEKRKARLGGSFGTQTHESVYSTTRLSGCRIPGCDRSSRARTPYGTLRK